MATIVGRALGGAMATVATRALGGALANQRVERAVLRELFRLGRSIERSCSAERSIVRAVRSGVCARNAASVFAMRTEELLAEHGGAAPLARHQMRARALSLEDGFEWVRRLGSHADALSRFERSGAFEPQQRTPEVRLRVGQLVAHRHFHVDSSSGTGVVYGWTLSCEAAVSSHESVAGFVDNRATFARIDKAGGRLRQPFYRVITRGGESRLVAQELLEPLGAHDAAADLPVQGASYFFRRIAERGQYEPNEFLRRAFPDG